MSISALVKGVEKRLRSVDVFNDAPDAPIGNLVGRQPNPGKPPANFGQFYCSVYWAGGTGTDKNPVRHDVFNGVVVTVTARLNYAPRDRQGVRLTTDSDVYDLVDRIIAPNVIHGNWLTITYANEFIEGTAEWIDIHNPSGSATVNGYIETLVLDTFGPDRLATADWVGSDKPVKDVYVIDAKFSLARRVQANY